MAIEETGSYVGGFNTVVDSNKPTDNPGKRADGAGEIRKLKAIIKDSFPNVTGAVTPTHTTLNYMDATSSVQTQLNAKAPIADPTFTGEIGIGSVNVSETELGILEGLTTTTTELNRVDATSSIQTQLNAKAPIANPTFTGEIGIGSVNVSETELGILEGLTTTTVELNRVDATSSIQTQLNAKAPIANPTFTGEIGIGSVNVNETELGILEGLTTTTAQLNYSTGLTDNIQDQIDEKSSAAAYATTSGGTTLSGSYQTLETAEMVVANASAAVMLIGTVTLSSTASSVVNLRIVRNPSGTPVAVSSVFQPSMSGTDKQIVTIIGYDNVPATGNEEYGIQGLESVPSSTTAGWTSLISVEVTDTTVI